jgi:hypothetical protein
MLIFFYLGGCFIVLGVVFELRLSVKICAGLWKNSWLRISSVW